MEDRGVSFCDFTNSSRCFVEFLSQQLFKVLLISKVKQFFGAYLCI